MITLFFMRNSLAAVLAFFCCAAVFAQQPADPPAESREKRVLYVTSDTQASAWSSGIVEGFQKVLTAQNQDIQLDVLRLSAGEYDETHSEVVGTLITFVKTRNYDLLVLAHNRLVDIFLEHANRINIETPVIFTAYFGENPAAEHPNLPLTGICIPPSVVVDNIRQGLVNQPNASEVFVIMTEAYEAGKREIAAFQSTLPDPTNPKINLIYRLDHTADDIVATAQTLPPNSFIIFAPTQPMPYTRRAMGHSAFNRLNDLQTAPIYTTTGRRGPYTPGGIGPDGPALGEQTARMALTLLSGTPTTRVPVEFAVSTPEFDWTVLRNLGFSSAKVPEGTRFINERIPFHIRHRYLFTALCTTLISALIFTGFTIFKRRQRQFRERYIFDTLPIRVCACDARGKILYLIHREFLKNTDAEIRTIDDLPFITNRFRESVRTVIENGKPFSFDYVAEGHHRRVDFMTLPPSVFGVPAALFVSVDTEAEFAARQEATNHAERFHFTLSAINDGVIAVNTDEIITLVNPAAARLLQKTEAEIIGRPLSQIFPLIDGATGIPVPSSAEKALRTATIVERPEPLIFIRPNGERLHISDSTAPICDHKDNVTGAVLVFRDVSGEQLRHDRMREQNTFLEASAELAAMTYFKLDGDPTTTPPVDTRYWGLDEEGRPLSPEAWIIPEDLPAYNAAWAELHAGAPKIHTRYASDATGTRRYFEQTVCLLNEETPGHRQWLGVIRDTTEARLEDQHHQDTLRLLQNLTDNLDCYLWVKEYPSGRYVMANAYYQAAMGLDGAVVQGRTDEDFFSPEAAAAFRRSDEEAFRTPGGLVIPEEPIDTASKGRRSISTRKVHLKREDGSDIILGMSYDITDQTTARAALSRANSILEAILNNLPVGIIVKDPSRNFNHIIWNKATERFTGVSAAEAIDKNDFEVPCSIAEPATAREQDLATLNKGTGFDAEISATDTEGRTRDLRYIKQRILLENDAGLILVLFHDITLEKEQQRKLRSLTDTLSAYVEQERLINRIMESLVLNDNDSDAMLQILAIIGQRTEAANSFIFKYNHADSAMRPYLEWVPEGSTPATPNYPDHPLDTTEPWHKAFKEGKPFILDDLTQPNQRAEAASWINILDQIGVRSIYAVPLRSGDTLWGHLEIDFDRPFAFTMLDNHLMEAAAHIIELIIERSINHMTLERSEKEKQLILDTVPIPIILFNKDQKVVLVNHAAVSHSKYTEEQLLEQPCGVSFCGSQEGYPDGLGCPVGRVLKTGVGESYVYTEGEYDFSAAATPIFDPITKELVYVVESAVDITEFNRTQKRLTEAMKEAQSADKAKSLFIATMSHELRTPLNAVIGFSELLQSGTLSLDAQKDCFKSINLAGSALLALINDVLDLSKIEADQIEIVKTPTNINAILDEIEAIFRHRAEQKDIFLSLDVPENLPILALDHLRFRQIILNLVGNAIKFTSIGGVTIRLRYVPDSPGAQTGTLTIQVSDSGIGIAPEQQERVFQPFVQETAGTRGNRSHEGTGLGLTISTRLVQCMGGTIELNSKIGQGSTFTVTLPNIAVTAKEGFRPNAKASPVPSAPTAQFKIPTYPPKNILIVDDVALNLKVLTAMLNRIGQKPLTADNATDALEIIRNNKLDLILTDIWMPKITGEELARTVRSIPEVKDIPIIAITADTEADTNFDMHLFNGRAFKPITIPSLIQVIAPYLEEKFDVSEMA